MLKRCGCILLFIICIILVIIVIFIMSLSGALVVARRPYLPLSKRRFETGEHDGARCIDNIGTVAVARRWRGPSFACRMQRKRNVLAHSEFSFVACVFIASIVSISWPPPILHATTTCHHVIAINTQFRLPSSLSPRR